MGRDGTTSEQTAPSVDQAELARALKRIERLKGDVAVSAIAAMGAGFLLRGWVDANDVQTVSMEDVRARLMALIKPQR
jgi:FlaA1/EpsC-like NDP-sugar epimerase